MYIAITNFIFKLFESSTIMVLLGMLIFQSRYLVGDSTSGKWIKYTALMSFRQIFIPNFLILSIKFLVRFASPLPLLNSLVNLSQIL